MTKPIIHVKICYKIHVGESKVTIWVWCFSNPSILLYRSLIQMFKPGVHQPKMMILTLMMTITEALF